LAVHRADDEQRDSQMSAIGTKQTLAER